MKWREETVQARVIMPYSQDFTRVQILDYSIISPPEFCYITLDVKCACSLWEQKRNRRLRRRISKHPLAEVTLVNMPTETFLTTLYTIVDDWYQQYAPKLLAGKVGTKPLFSDSEVITLSIAQHWLGVPDEREFLRLVRNNFLPLFPRLVSQGQFNRQARNLCWLINQMRQRLVAQMGLHLGLHQASCQLIDGTPIDGTPIKLRHWRRFGKGHLLLPEAALGHCAAKKETFYGFRLLALTTLDGIVVAWDLLLRGTCLPPTPMSAKERRIC